jgi:hypothetical protein
MCPYHVPADQDLGGLEAERGEQFRAGFLFGPQRERIHVRARPRTRPG